jgi:hypothetical protein
MTPINETIALYFNAWNDPTAAGCDRWLEKSCSPSVAYTDPRYTCSGITELAARIQGSRSEAPTYRVDVTSAIDGYDDTFRYTWVFVVAEANLRIPGLDVIVRGTDGRIRALTSFFGVLQPIDAGAPPRVQPRWQL